MEAPASATTPSLAWKWILEKLVDLPDFGVVFINEVITSHVTDIEEPHCRSLLERVALRYLEEMVVTNQVDSDAIPLLKALIGQDLGTPGITKGSSVKQRFNKELVLRVQTEVVLSVLRKDVDEEKDWALYESELERVFGEAEEDNRLLDRKRELSALLKSKNQTKATIAAYFEKYSLNKLRNDLYSFIDEKKVSFETMFLNQLSRDFLDANGKPFPEELGDVEKSAKVEANGKQEVGQYPKVNATRDRYIVLGTSTVSGKKRLRRKLLPTQDEIDDDEAEEAQEGSAGMKKPRQVPSTSIFNPLKTTLLRQGVSELVVPAFGVESCKQLSLLNRGEKPLSDARNLGPEVMKSCSPAAHERISTEGVKIPPREPSRTNKYVVISDVESDAETQVVKRLSTDGEDSVAEKVGDDNHNKKGAQSPSENGHPQNIVETEVERKETIIVQIERKTLVDRKKGSPEAKVSHQEDNEKFITKNEFIPLDNSQDTYEVDFLEVGSDGHEEVCHTCGKHGILLCCDGCPISMHFDCIEVLGLRLPKGEEDWYCPVCLSLKAAWEAAEAEKAAVAAKEKLKAFKMEIKKRQSSPEGDELQHSGEQGAFKQPRLRIRSLQSGENDRALKPKQQQNDEEPKLVRQDSDPSKASLLPTVLRNALRQLKQSGEQDKSDHLFLPEDKSPSNRVVSLEQGADGMKKVSDAGRALRVNEQLVKNASPKSLVKRGIPDGSAKPVCHNGDVRTPQKMHHSHDVSRGDPFAASTSGQAKRESERFARFSTKKGPEVVDSGEESAEQAGTAGVPEPGRGAGGRREIERDKDDEDLDEDRGKKPEHRHQGALFSGRQKLPGLRRKHLPWTREEEHALKEGVKRYSHNGSWGFQWKRILEFGQGRFDPSRTYVDLKDKWRNLVKGVS